jgi:hypothetical protein
MHSTTRKTQADSLSALVVVVGSTLLFAVGWAKLEAVVKPLSDSIMDKLKYVSMPDHSGKIGYQHAVRRQRPVRDVWGRHVVGLARMSGHRGSTACSVSRLAKTCAHASPPRHRLSRTCSTSRTSWHSLGDGAAHCEGFLCV